jgi:integrase
MRGKGEGSIYRVPSDPSKPLRYWVAAIELPNPTGRPQDRRRKTAKSKDKAVAREKLREMQNELRRKGDLRTSSTTVDEWFVYWLREYASPSLRPKALESYRSNVNQQIIPSLGPKTRIDKVTPAMVKRLRADIVAKGLSSTYARNAHHILARSLSDAAGEGWIPSNPTDYVTPPRKAARTLDVLSLDEAIALLRAIQERRDRARWATSILTGARRGEVIGIERDRVGDVLDLSWQLQRLKWEHGCGEQTPDGWPCEKKYGAYCPDRRYDFPADYEFRPLQGGLYLTRPKSSAGWRIIPLVDPLRSILNAHIAATDPGDHGLVFANPGGGPRDPDWDSKQWHALMIETFGPERAVRLHDLRHTTVDLLYFAGVPEDIIQEIVGHSTRTMTRSYKSRSDIKRLSDAMSQFSALFTQPGTERTLEIGA